MSRVLCWFSCGAASACTAKLAVEAFGSKCELLYCDTLAYEHPDNLRFLKDVEQWVGVPIKILKSDRYTDIFDVFRKERWLVGPGGARCTTELKKVPRKEYQEPDDVHCFGFSQDEQDRIEKFERNNPELLVIWILKEFGLQKRDCLRMVKEAGIELPAMYRLGYRNNNCIGCVKGGAGYWNKIRVDFPEAFDRMAKMEREIGASIFRQRVKGQKERVSIYLDELPVGLGRYDSEPDIECGPQCAYEAKTQQLEITEQE